MKTNIKKELYLTLIPLGVGINMGIGEIVYLLKLPIFLDAIGTIIITLLLGWRAGILAGVLSFVFLTIMGLNPYTVYFCLTQAVIALFIYFAGKMGNFKNIPRIILSGVLLGIVAAIFSAPVKVYLFGGVEGTGSGLLIAYLIKTGESIIKSVLFAGLSIEPIDKTIQLLLAIIILKSIPKKILSNFKNPLLSKNKLL